MKGRANMQRRSPRYGNDFEPCLIVRMFPQLQIA